MRLPGLGSSTSSEDTSFSFLLNVLPSLSGPNEEQMPHLERQKPHFRLSANHPEGNKFRGDLLPFWGYQGLTDPDDPSPRRAPRDPTPSLLFLIYCTTLRPFPLYDKQTRRALYPRVPAVSYLLIYITILLGDVVYPVFT